MCTRYKKNPKTKKKKSSSDPKLLWQLRKIQENDKNSPSGWWHFRFDVIILLNGEPPFSLIRVVTWETYRFYDLWFLPTSQELPAWSPVTVYFSLNNQTAISIKQRPKTPNQSYLYTRIRPEFSLTKFSLWPI